MQTKISKKKQLRIYRVVLWGAGVSVTSAYGVTNGVQHSIPGLVRLVSKDLGSCTGSVIGDSPIKVSVALHCLSNFETGGLQMQMPGEERLIESQKAFISPDPALNAQLALERVMVTDLLAMQKSIALLAQQLNKLQNDKPDILTELFTNKGELKAQEVKRQLAIADNMKAGVALSQRIHAKHDEISHFKDAVIFKFFDHEFAVLTFAESLPNSDATPEQKVEEFRILPLARESLPSAETAAIVGGFGIRAGFTGVIPNLRSFLSTNTLSSSNHRKDTYVVFGYTAEDTKKYQIKAGSLGSILPGDSGGPLLTAYGMAGVASMIHTYMSPSPPRKGWKNMYDESAPFESYRSLQAVYPSTASPVSQEILARVEREVSPLVYADQVPVYEQAFKQLQGKIENSPAPIDEFNIFTLFR